MREKEITHIPGTFLISADASFLNGAGLSKTKEFQNTTLVKAFQDGIGDKTRYMVPYVSAQAFRRYWRDTVNEEANWKPSQMRQLQVNKDLHTSKVGGEFNPIEFEEDDVFGYMRTAAKEELDEEEGEEKEVEIIEEAAGEQEQKKKGVQLKSLKRTSPLSTSILMSLRKDGWQGLDEAWVHVVGGTPTPYNTQFMSTTLQGIFCLNYRRLCRFENVADNIELREDLVERFLKEDTIKEVGQREYYSVDREVTELKKKDKSGKAKTKIKFDKVTKHGSIYEMTNAESERKKRASELLNALARLEGGAKQAAFATDISPKVLITAGLHNCANPIFNNLFEDDRSSNTRGKSVKLNVDALKEIATDYNDRLATPIFIGIRTGYLQNEYAVKQLTEKEGFIVTTPIDAARRLSDYLNKGGTTTTTGTGPDTDEMIQVEGTRVEIGGVG